LKIGTQAYFRDISQCDELVSK